MGAVATTAQLRGPSVQDTTVTQFWPVAKLVSTFAMEHGLGAKFKRWWTVILSLLPTLAAAVYYGAVASDRYVSEAKFVVRTASKPAGTSGLSAILQMSGLGRAQDEVFAVQAYMTSRTAAQELAKRLPLRNIYSRPEADIITKYPSILFGSSNEELHRYLGWMVQIVYDSASGITTLRVQAFRPDDAKLIASELLALSEQTVNDMNTRIQRDAVTTSEKEVKRYEERLIAAQQAITRFRNSELIIDPAGSSVVATELIGRLSAELSATEARLREVSAAASVNPQLQSLRMRAEALRGQIAQERSRISSDTAEGGLASKLAIYERLALDREFAKQSLEAAVRAHEAAQGEARRQQIYVERVVEPVAADKAMVPERLRMIFTVLGANIILIIVGWLVLSGLREHGSEHGS